jgi:hypothetical protein
MGMNQVTVVPPCSRGAMSNVPPCRSARLRMLARPPLRLLGLMPVPSSRTLRVNSPDRTVRSTSAQRAWACREMLVSAFAHDGDNIVSDVGWQRVDAAGEA